MTRVRGRTILANFETRASAHEASQRIRERRLGTTRISDLTARPGPGVAVGTSRSEAGLLGDDASLYSANNLGPLSSTDYALIQDSLDHPSALIGHRPRLGSILLTVITSEENVPAVVAIVKEQDGWV